VKLYDRCTSPNCQRTRVVLCEKNLSYETIPVDLVKKEQKRPEFLRLNPYGKVPVIIDGHTILYESCIINEYLEEQYQSPPLLPKAPALRAKIRIQIDYGVNGTLRSYEKLRDEMVKEESQRNLPIISESKTALKSLLRRFEDEIYDNQYLAGDFSLLDAAVIPRFLRLATWGTFADLPRLSAWVERMKIRPSVQRMIASETPAVQNSNPIEV
jgi:glutathione S-transferase